MRHTLTFTAIASLTCLSALTVQAETQAPAPRAAEPDMLVGAYYFPGWSQESRWYCIKAHDDVQHPLLGYYREGEPEVADWHIKWALEHGVSFFAFDYYINDGAEMLEGALERGFLKADYIDQFRFCLNWCNHAPAETQTREELERFFDVALEKYLPHPSYLRIDGKPVVMILSGHSFVKTLGVEGAREAFDAMEQRMIDAGLGGMYLVFCEGNILRAEDVTDSLATGADALCLYNYPYAGTEFTGPGAHGEASYEHLIEQGRGLWTHWKTLSGGKFWPTVMPGWDRRPWLKEADLIRTGSTPKLFGQSLEWARESVNADKVVMVEAWNEWGEGSILEPSEEFGFEYLDQVRRVFCSDPAPLEPETPKSVGAEVPCFRMELPSISRWLFDFDTEGWHAQGAGPLTHSNGAVTMQATGDDPQIVSDLTYVNCDDFSRLFVRMRLTPSPDGPETGVGQVFWLATKGQWGPPAVVSFDVYLDAAWHTYEVDLHTCPAWRGLTERIRLDPVGAPGTRIEIDIIELAS